MKLVLLAAIIGISACKSRTNNESVAYAGNDADGSSHVSIKVEDETLRIGIGGEAAAEIYSLLEKSSKNENNTRIKLSSDSTFKVDNIYAFNKVGAMAWISFKKEELSKGGWEFDSQKGLTFTDIRTTTNLTEVLTFAGIELKDDRDRMEYKAKYIACYFHKIGKTKSCQITL